VSINKDTSYHVYILIHTISLFYESTMEVNVHNQCSGFNLRHHTCFRASMDREQYPDDEVNPGSMTSVKFIPFLSTFGGVLTYVLEKEDAKSEGQPKSIYTLLFISWKFEGYKKFCAFVHLVECEDLLFWTKAKREEYYQRYTGQLYMYTDTIKDIWLIHDGTVLKTELTLDFTQRDGVLNVTISEGVRDGRLLRPIWIGPER
jgi:hypothetical protein